MKLYTDQPGLQFYTGNMMEIKYDGKYKRNLFPAEIAQIAGRAGRSSKNGTFGVINDGLKVEKELLK